jgi:hypothetical protein
MRASNVVIAVNELAQHPRQMGITEDEKMIKAFLSDGTDPSLGVSIRIRSSKGCGQNVETLAGENGIECIRVLAIVVTIRNRKRGVTLSSFHRIWLACCVTQAWVGLAVTPAR